MFRLPILMDIGSKNTHIALEEGVRTEATLISLTTHAGKQKLAVGAVGNAALGEASPLSPVREGAAANVRLLSLLISHLVRANGGKSFARRTELFLALSRTMGEAKRRAFLHAAELGGFRARLLDVSLMGAIGAGADVFSDEVSVVIDVGHETVRCAAAANGGLIYESLEAGGSVLAERAIQNHLRDKHRILIGARMAEIIKRNLDKPSLVIEGRSTENALPRAVRLSGAELIEPALAGSMGAVRLAADFARALPPEAAADMLTGGVTLIGGGARLIGLAELISGELGVGVRIAPNAETAVADGMRKFAFLNKKEYEALKAEPLFSPEAAQSAPKRASRSR